MSDELRARIDRRDELADQIKRAATDADAIRYDEDDWTRIADAVLPIIDRVRAEARREALTEAADQLMANYEATKGNTNGPESIQHDIGFDNGTLSAVGQIRRTIAREATP